MNKLMRDALVLVGVLALVGGCGAPARTPVPAGGPSVPVRPLPTPYLKGGASLHETLASRRSTRVFANSPLSQEELGQLLWAAQGVTNERGFRTAPSAGALYPLEVYVATSDGIYHYQPQGHELLILSGSDQRQALYEAALRQEPVDQAPAVFIIAAVYARTEVKYGTERSPRYVHLEAGHAAQNLLLEAVALGLGAVPVGAFEDERVQQVLDLPEDHQPLYLIPVGRPRETGP